MCCANSLVPLPAAVTAALGTLAFLKYLAQYLCWTGPSTYGRGRKGQCTAANLVQTELFQCLQVVARRGGSKSQIGRWRGMDADQDASDDQVREHDVRLCRGWHLYALTGAAGLVCEAWKPPTVFCGLRADGAS